MRAEAFISSAATARRGARASGSATDSRAPPPPAKRKLPGSPRRWAMRSGKPAAISLAGSPAGAASRGSRRRRRYCAAARRMRESAPRSAPGASGPSRSATSAGASGPRIGSRSSSRAASSAASAASPASRAVSIIAASRGCAPSRAIALPCPVIRPLSSSAPSSVSSATPAARAPSGGGSGKGRSAGAVPQAAQSSTRPESSACMISGCSCAGRPRCSASVQSRIATPGASRPARPARCSAAARLMRSVSSRVRPVPASRRGARRNPPSTTTRTPGTVSEVSAIDVASTTRLVSAGRSARSCSAWGSSPCSGNTSAPHPASAASVRRISPMPGRKARMSPASPASAARIARRHRIGQVARGGEVALGVADRDRVHPPCRGDGLRRHQRGQAREVRRRRHGEQAQLGAEHALQVEAEGEREIGVEPAFMHLVEDHRGDAVEPGIGLQPPHQEPFGDHLDPRRVGHRAVEPGAVTDRAARRLADQRGHPRGRRAGGEAARLEHDDAAGAAPRTRRARRAARASSSRCRAAPPGSRSAAPQAPPARTRDARGSGGRAVPACRAVSTAAPGEARLRFARRAPALWCAPCCAGFSSCCSPSSRSRRPGPWRARR